MMDGSLTACPLHVTIDGARQLSPRCPFDVVLFIGFNEDEVKCAEETKEALKKMGKCPMIEQQTSPRMTNTKYVHAVIPRKLITWKISNLTKIKNFDFKLGTQVSVSSQPC